MPQPLVIVESPAKARTISSFLGPGYLVESSIGHIRDLPRNAAEVPAAIKGEKWARLGVDTHNDFKPVYVVPAEKKDQVRKLKGLLKGASELYLATDEDREGESIAWHLLEVLNPKVPVKRMVFHEITKAAILHAVTDWRELDRRLVEAQEARRILDRLYGYEVSPVLWKMVKPKLSAGRVQSPAVRIIVDRERERLEFRSAGYWDLVATFTTRTQPAESFDATLVSVNGARVAGGKDFASTGELTSQAVVHIDSVTAARLAADLAQASFDVRSLETKPYRRSPSPPFRTSTLQQEAARRYRFSSARTMSAAQRLYENGYITYMRTDSVALSETAIATARAQVQELYGREFLPDKARVYASKVRNAQEAHEAIRPAGDRFRTPDQVQSALHADEFRLYDLIWKRTVASQMVDAVGESLAVRVGTTSGKTDAEFAASGLTITFAGFMRAHVEGSDDPDAELELSERRLPPLAQAQPLDASRLETAEHATQPPPRFTEASLIKRLEELGIGRPSTYASIMSTIQDRGYVWKKGTALVPSITAFAAITLLERHFAELVDYEFTARLEDTLDEIANGEAEAVPWLRAFYFGNGDPGLLRLVSEHLGEIDPREVNAIPLGVDANGVPIEARAGRYGPFLQRGENTVSIPEDLPLDELTVERALELLEAPSQERSLGIDPGSGLEVQVKVGRFGPYVQLGEMPNDGKPKPKTASLLASMAIDTLSLEEALSLLSLPRTVGVDQAGVPIEALNGRFGPYLIRGKDTRSLENEEQIFSIDVAEALALLAQPKRGRRQAASALAVIGKDPETDKSIEVRKGRFGIYVTDGETNASLRTGDDPARLGLERALELLGERRARVASGVPARRKSATAKKKSGKAKSTATKSGNGGRRTTRTTKRSTKQAVGVSKQAARLKRAAKRSVKPTTKTNPSAEESPG